MEGGKRGVYDGKGREGVFMMERGGEEGCMEGLGERMAGWEEEKRTGGVKKKGESGGGRREIRTVERRHMEKERGMNGHDIASQDFSVLLVRSLLCLTRAGGV